MAVCTSCKDPLVLDVDGGDGSADEIVPDDLLLSCGCHFHWQCLLDEAAQVANSITCPSCGIYLSATPLAAASSSSSSAAPSLPSGIQILTRYVNEGGLQDNYDIFPDIAEEAYLQAHPEARSARAFLTMCAAGDVMGIVSLLSDEEADEDEEEEEGSPAPKLPLEDLLRYQDPLGGLQSGLHVAVQNNQEEVAYLLLFLASRLPLEAFPPAVLQSAEQVGLTRPASVATHADIRTLQDQHGETARAYAARMGLRWPALES